MFTDTEYDEALFPTFTAFDTRSPTGDVLDQSALDQSALDQSALDQSALDQSALDQSALDQSALDQSALDQSALDQSALAQLAFEKETECTSWFASSGLVTNGAVGSLLNRICVVNPPLAAGIIVPD